MQLFEFNLASEFNNQLFIPRGFAHGFQCLTEDSIIYYKTDNYYEPHDQYGIHPLDIKLNINWPISEKIISNNDLKLPNSSEIENFLVIVLTGSSGQVGSELKKQLKLNNHPYKAFDKISLDITSKNSIKSNLDKIKNLKVIINLAAYTNVEECQKKSSPNKK